MAQLPPKIPTIDHHSHELHQWPEFRHDNVPHQHHDYEASGHQNPSWVDEFMEFSAAKRGAHRRSVSDSSVAFVLGPGPGQGPFQAHHDGDDDDEDEDQFEKLDDEQLMSMFSNELGSSSTSDHNSTNEEQSRRRSTTGKERERAAVVAVMEEERERKAVEEAEISSCEGNDKEAQEKGEAAGSGTGHAGAAASGDDQQQVVDPKRVRRILANRQSAQRSRVRKLQYISELERSVTALQSEVSVLSPRVAFLDHQRMILNVDNSTLKAKIAALAQDKIFKDAHQEALKREIEKLRQVYYQYQQNMKMTEGTITPPSSSPLPSPAMQRDIKDNEIESEQLIR